MCCGVGKIESSISVVAAADEHMRTDQLIATKGFKSATLSRGATRRELGLRTVRITGTAVQLTGSIRAILQVIRTVYLKV